MQSRDGTLAFASACPTQVATQLFIALAHSVVPCSTLRRASHSVLACWHVWERQYWAITGIAVVVIVVATTTKLIINLFILLLHSCCITCVLP